MKPSGIRMAALLTLITIFVLLKWVVADAQQRSGTTAASGSDYIEGVVTSSMGPEAGVWVIAETTDLPTRFFKIVVTDDQGRYALPQLPHANYSLFVRGYGLVDSRRVSAKPGQHLDLKAMLAPDARAAAQVYPANYWLSMMNLPNTEGRGCGLPCHQVGDKATREIPASLGKFPTSLDAWMIRTQAGPVGAMMSAAFQKLGDNRKIFSDWTDRIAAGEYPKEAPPRPTGIERNFVVTMWDWGTPTSFMHDESAGVDFDPSVNANGRIYGVSNSSDIIVWVDPNTNTVGQLPIPSKATGIQKMNAKSPYWGNEEVWQPVAQPRSAAVDTKGRLWFGAAFRGTLQGFGGGTSKGGTQPNFCQAGSTNKFAQYFPMNDPSGKQAGLYDQRTGKVTYVDTCFTTDHNQFDKDGKLFFGMSNVVGWVDTATYDKTHSDEASQGWIPAVLDTNGDGKITKPWTEPDQPIDPTKDHRVNFGCYSISVSPTDGSLWCSGNQLVRIERGPNPPESAKAEIYDPPDGITGGHGVIVDDNGVLWENWQQIDTVTSFDRRKCKGSLNGPSATGKQCPEGWTVFRKRDQNADSANIFYLIYMDPRNVLGLGENIPVVGGANTDALLALIPATGKWVTMRVPYPMGYFPRSMQPRIDDPKAGWKGRGVWSNYTTYAPWHIEGGNGVKNKVVKFQMRPDPLAR